MRPPKICLYTAEELSWALPPLATSVQYILPVGPWKLFG